MLITHQAVSLEIPVFLDVKRLESCETRLETLSEHLGSCVLLLWQTVNTVLTIVDYQLPSSCVGLRTRAVLRTVWTDWR